MAWDNLYKWEKGFEPAGIIELRKAKNEQIKAYQRSQRDKQNAKIRNITLKTIGNMRKDMPQSAFDAIAASCLDAGIKIGNAALKRRLKAFGYDCSNASAKHVGWPKNWPEHINKYISHWLADGHVLKAFYADEFVFVEDIANSCIQQYINDFGEDDIADLVSTRCFRRALEIKGFSSIKIRDGMIALIGYRLYKAHS